MDDGIMSINHQFLQSIVFKPEDEWSAAQPHDDAYCWATKDTVQKKKHFTNGLSHL